MCSKIMRQHASVTVNKLQSLFNMHFIYLFMLTDFHTFIFHKQYCNNQSCVSSCLCARVSLMYIPERIINFLITCLYMDMYCVFYNFLDS